MTLLDAKLQEMASKNWEQFVQMIGPDAIIKAKTCMLRQNGKSYGEISNALGISWDKVRNTARYNCNSCQND